MRGPSVSSVSLSDRLSLHPEEEEEGGPYDWRSSILQSRGSCPDSSLRNALDARRHVTAASASLDKDQR